MLSLRGGSSKVEVKAARDDWANMPPGKRREFAQLSADLDRWLSQSGLALENATRPQILEALHCTRKAKLEAPPPQKDSSFGVSPEGWEGARNNLTSAELAERMLLACRLGDVDVVRESLAAGTPAGARDSAGWTGLHHAALLNRVLVLQTLLEAPDTDANVRTPDGVTPLMLAASRGHALACEQLIAVGGAAVGATEPRTGRAALHAAAHQGWRNVCTVLLRHGAAPDAEDALGRPPAALALANRFLRLGAEIHAAAAQAATAAEHARLLAAAGGLSPHETAIAAAAGLPLGAARPAEERRRAAWMGTRLEERLDATRFDFGRPGLPPLLDPYPGPDGTLAFEAGRALGPDELARRAGALSVPEYVAFVARECQAQRARRRMLLGEDGDSGGSDSPARRGGGDAA